MPRPPEYDRETVISQAMAVFWERGYNRTSVGHLVAATGLQPGSLYAAFGNKKGVFLEVVDQYNLAFLRNLQALREGSGRAIDKIDGLLRQVAEDRLVRNDERGCLSVNALLEMSQHDAEISDRLRGYNQRLRAAFVALIHDAQSEGDIAAERNAEALALFLMNNIWGMRIMCKNGPDRPGAEAVVDGVMVALQS